jgi:hypothetical protein
MKIKVICELVGNNRNIALTVQRGGSSIGVRLIPNELERWIELKQYALQLANVLGAEYINTTDFS